MVMAAMALVVRTPPNRRLTDCAPLPIESRIAATGAECVVMVLDWIRKLRAAAQIAAVMPC
jgi:hypothetical protein